MQPSGGQARSDARGPLGPADDIDVLLYDELIVNEPELTIPHPRMTERSFVVLPLLELDPDPILADGTRILDLAVDGDRARPYAPPLVLP